MATDVSDIEYMTELKKLAAAKNAKSLCPNCGYCQTCGRQRYAGPWYPYPYWGWTYPNWVVTTSPTMTTTTTANNNNFTLTC